MRTLATLVLFLVPCFPAWSQTATEPDYRRSYGGAVLVSNSGFGGGAFLRTRAGRQRSTLFELAVTPVTHADDDPLAGVGGSRLRANHVLGTAFSFGLELPLFRSALVEVLRPFLLFMAGPSLSWEYPAFHDRNGDGRRSPDEAARGGLSSFGDGRLLAGFGGVFALGAHFGRGHGLTQGIRLGVRVLHYPAGLRLLTADQSAPVRWYVSPEILVYLGRLF